MMGCLIMKKLGCMSSNKTVSWKNWMTAEVKGTFHHKLLFLNMSIQSTWREICLSGWNVSCVRPAWKIMGSNGTVNNL